MKTQWILTIGLLASQASFAMTLEEYLLQVQNKNKNLQSLGHSQEASLLKKVAGDTELTPVLTAGVSYLSDKSPIGQGVSIGARGGIETTSYSLGFAKKFSTGTSFQVGAEASAIELIGLSPQAGIPSEIGLGSLSFGFSQSLWKNAFGQGTGLRQDREAAVYRAENSGLELQKRATLTEAESAFWDFLYVTEEVKIREASLGRAKRILNWTERRVNDGISDRADLLSAQALVAARELQVLVAMDEKIAAEKKVRDTLELGADEATPNLVGNINSKRALSDMVGGKGRVVSLAALVAEETARAKQFGAKEAEDSLRSDLVLAGKYKTNALEEDIGNAAREWTNSSYPTQSLALTWTYMFDTDVKSANISAAKKEALASQLLSERKALESQTQWSELNRRYMELSKKIEAARKISEIQTSRARAEVDKFNKGRSVTANVINSEEDAAEAELTLTKLKTEQRKLEAQSRVFVAAE